MAEDNQKLNNALVDEMAEQQEEVINYSEAEMSVLKEMAQKGIMFGHKKTRTNPKFKPYIFTTRNGIEIIDLGKTLKAIDEVAEFLNKLIKEQKTVLLVGTQPASWEALNNFSQKFKFPFVKNGWVGGLVTNFKIVGQRIEYFKGLKKGMETGEFDKYTKKERVMMNKEIEKMQGMFEGFEDLIKIPDAIFIVDTFLKGHMTALKEAKIAKIPVIAIVDSDDDPKVLDYAIPANDHSKMSVDWVIGKIIEKIQ